MRSALRPLSCCVAEAAACSCAVSTPISALSSSENWRSASNAELTCAGVKVVQQGQEEGALDLFARHLATVAKDRHRTHLFSRRGRLSRNSYLMLTEAPGSQAEEPTIAASKPQRLPRFQSQTQAIGMEVPAQVGEIATVKHCNTPVRPPPSYLTKHLPQLCRLALCCLPLCSLRLLHMLCCLSAVLGSRRRLGLGLIRLSLPRLRLQPRLPFTIWFPLRHALAWTTLASACK